MRLGTDSWSVDENDDANSAYPEEKENLSSKRYEMSKWSFDDATLVTE